MSKNEVAVSVLNVDSEGAISLFYKLETAKVDYFHIDVMDGVFVENNTHDKMYEFATTLANITNIKQDIHLMVKDVKKYVDIYSSLGRNRITFHVEALETSDEILEMINYIKDTGNQVGLAVSPDTGIDEIYPYLPYIHSVIVMTVQPGKGGQKLIEDTLIKIEQLKNAIDEFNNDINIEADGGINDSNCEKVRNAGANILLSGTFLVKNADIPNAVKTLRGL